MLLSCGEFSVWSIQCSLKLEDSSFQEPARAFRQESFEYQFITLTPASSSFCGPWGLLTFRIFSYLLKSFYSLLQATSCWCFVWKDFSGYLSSVLPEAKAFSICQGETMCFKDFQIWGENITLKFFGTYEQWEEDAKEKFIFYNLHHHAINFILRSW